MENQQRLVQIFDPLFLVLAGDVIEELLFDDERAPAKAYRGLAALVDFGDGAGEIIRNMGGIERRADGGHGFGAGNIARRRQHGGAAKTMADKNAGRFMVFGKPIRRRHQIAHIGGEIGVGEFPARMAEAGKIKTQHGDAAFGQPGADAGGGENILGTGKAMGKQGIGAGRARRHIQARRQVITKGAGEGDFVV